VAAKLQSTLLLVDDGIATGIAVFFGVSQLHSLLANTDK
jgi:predicted phosphoribosyltransferase